MSLSPTTRLGVSVFVPAGVGLVGAYVAVRMFESYGWTLFLGLPIVVSFLSALIFRRTGPSSWLAAYGISLVSILIVGVLILIFAVDGFLCLLMALPLAGGLALPGATFGYLLGKRLSHGVVGTVPVMLVLAFPFLVAFESARPSKPPLHAVTTHIAVSAPIQSVWNEVIAFDKIEQSPGGVFRLGIAYPIEARIEGRGVGAIRYCVFSTGPFIEPITRWEAPHALEFDVTSNPPPMKEISPWGPFETPHLHNTFLSEKGRFHLREENGQTILEGTTWYRQSMAPDFYWHRISDHIIHLIHLRVLEHIKKRAENAASR